MSTARASRATVTQRIVAMKRPYTMATCIMAVACADSGNPGADGATVRDSAGVHVVRNHTPAWAAEGAWMLTSRPLLEIGAGPDPAQQLYNVNGALRLSDGRIVIANSGTNQLRFFGNNGEWLFDRGGEGGGPGEFEDMTGLSRYGDDSLVVFDRRQRRWTVFGIDGALGSTRAFDEGALIFPIGTLADRSMVASVPYSVLPPTEGEIHRESFEIIRVAASAGATDTILTLLGQETFRHGRFPAIIPFARSSLTAARGDVLYSVDTGIYELMRYDADGNLLGIFDRPTQLRSVDDEALEAFKTQRLADLPQSFRQAMGPALEAAPGPPTMPVIGALEVDAAGNVWSANYQAPSDSGGITWSVFDRNGRWLGEIAMPDGFTVLDIGDAYILGLMRDHLDVEYIAMYGLNKSPDPPTAGGG